jgi:hypothetical protein
LLELIASINAVAHSIVPNTAIPYLPELVLQVFYADMRGMSTALSYGDCQPAMSTGFTDWLIIV